MSNNDSIILPLLESMDKKELLTVISIANGLIKTKQMAEQSKQSNPLEGLLKVIAEKLILAGIGIAEEKLLSLLHGHKKAIGEAAVPVTDESLKAAKCQAGYVWDSSKGQCVPDVG